MSMGIAVLGSYTSESQRESLQRNGDGPSVSDVKPVLSGFKNEDINIGILSQSRGNDQACGASSDDNKVV